MSSGCRSVGRAVGWSGANLALQTTSSGFDQFSWNLAQMCALGCRCARHIFRQWQRECCHGNGILWQKWGGGNLASRTTSSVFHQFSWNLAQMFALGCRCARHIFFDSGRKCVAMVIGNGILWQKWGKILRRELLPQFFTNSHEIWHRCLPWGVDVQDTFCWQWQKVCCHGNGILWQKWGENLASRTTSSVFHQFSCNLAQMFALGCRCARHILLTVAESVLPW